METGAMPGPEPPHCWISRLPVAKWTIPVTPHETAMSAAASHDATPKPLTLSDLAATCWRHRWASLGAAALVAVTVVLATFRLTPMYEATATLAVDKGHKAVDFQVDPTSGSIEFSLLNTQREMIVAAPVLEQCLKGSDLLQGPAYADAGGDPVKVLKERIKVTTKRDSWVIGITLRDESAERAERALRSLLDAYAASQAAQKSDKAGFALHFLSDQVSTARERLEEARKREQEFRVSKALVDSDPDKNAAAMRLAQLNQDRGGIDKAIAEAQALLHQLDQANAAGDRDACVQALLRIEAVNRHPVVVEQQKLLYELQDKAVLLGQKYQDKHPRMIEITEQILAKRAHLAEACALAQATVRGHYQELQLQAAEIKVRIAAAEDELNAYRTNLANLQALIQETKSREDMHQTLLKRFNEEQVAGGYDAKQVTVIEPPKAGTRPVNIKKPLFLAAALFLGLVAGVLVALVAETLDRRVRGAAATQELTQLTLLGQLPFVAGLAPLGKGGDPEQPNVLAESYRALRAALRLSRHAPAGCQVLVVTSSGPGEGKSTVTTRLGISLASAGGRVLLVDGDLRKPSLQRQLGDATERGFSFLLAGEQDIAPVATEHQRLDFLAVGVRPPNPAELLHSPAFAQAIARWRAAYDYVLIDTPPLGLVTDALIAGEHADGVVLVVRDRVTAKSTLRLVLDRLAPIRGKVLGVVFNAEQLAGSGYGYYYQYQYKYGYGGQKPALPERQPEPRKA
jgi:capsular exopolysaccharide synthesis family protein